MSEPISPERLAEVQAERDRLRTEFADARNALFMLNLGDLG